MYVTGSIHVKTDRFVNINIQPDLGYVVGQTYRHVCMYVILTIYIYIICIWGKSPITDH